MKGIKILMALFIALYLFSCTDEFSEAVPHEDSPSIYSRSSPSGSNTQKSGNSTVEKTVLGIRRVNPFTVAHINAAKQTLYGTAASLVTVTHQYVKFLPTTQDHLADLDAWETLKQIPLFDFPLEYEIIEAGESYHDPAVADPLYTFQYASVPIGTILPVDVPHEIIDDLYLDHSDPLLIAQSFMETGNGHEIDDYFNSGGGVDPPAGGGGMLGGIPPEPDCPEGTHAQLFINDNVNPVSYLWVCIPTEVGDGDGGDNGGEPNLNACGCPIPFNVKNPAGCVQVDLDGDNLPVTSVTVKTKNSWFTSDFATTDENGCWHISKSYGGNMWMFIVYKNSACKVRDTGYWTGLRVVKDYIGRFNEPFNNILVQYSDGTEDIITNNERRFWAACHTINTIVDYREAAANNGIAQPRPHLNILNIAGDGASSAPMLQGVQYGAWPAFLIVFSPLLNVLNYATNSLKPDVTLMYGDNDDAIQLITVLHHEFAHASHIQVVGELYWVKYRNHIINNLGYGSFGSFNIGSHPGYVALGEAFAEFVANQNVDSPLGGDDISFDPIWSTEPENFIPRGLMFDLGDNTTDLITDPNDGSSSIDNVSGFTRAMIFSAMDDPNINSIRKFRDRLRTLHLANTPNTTADFNALLDQYDVFN